MSQDDFVNINTSSYVPNIILNGISQACPNVNAVTVSEVSTSGATVSWTAGTAQTNFEIIVQFADLESPSSSTNGEALTANSYQLTDLVANTLYSVYIRTICEDDLSSAWGSAINFSTLCNPVGDFYQ